MRQWYIYVVCSVYSLCIVNIENRLKFKLNIVYLSVIKVRYYSGLEN